MSPLLDMNAKLVGKSTIQQPTRNTRTEVSQNEENERLSYYFRGINFRGI